MTFRLNREPRQFTEPAIPGVTPESLFIGAGAMALEVLVYHATRRPSTAELRELHRERVGRRCGPRFLVRHDDVKAYLNE